MQRLTLLAVLLLSAFVVTLTSPAGAAGSGSLSLSPASGQFKTGENVTTTIIADTGGAMTNATQANLRYPLDLLEFVSIQNEDSSFNVVAADKNAGGVIMIARGSTKKLSGRLTVAKVVWRAKSAGTAAISFSSGSAIVSTPENKNIANLSTGASYQISGSTVTKSLEPATQAVVQVVDASDRPVIGAKVALGGEIKSTDLLGRAHFSNIPAGVQTAIITTQAGEQYSQEVRLKDGGSKPQEVKVVASKKGSLIWPVAILTTASIAGGIFGLRWWMRRKSRITSDLRGSGLT